MKNWKSILGIFIIMSAISEFISVSKQYQSGKLSSWPWGIQLGIVGVMGLGFLLIRSGMKQKKL